MSEGLTIKQITIVRIITMTGGVLGALVLLHEYGFFYFGPQYTLTLSNALVLMVGVLCLIKLIKHCRIWRDIRRSPR
jgi:hypothetical protein